MSGFSPQEIKKLRELYDTLDEGGGVKLSIENKKETTEVPISTYNAHGFNISINFNKLVEFFFINHFYFSSFLLIFSICAYLVHEGSINLGNILHGTDIFITSHHFHLMVTMAIIAIFMILWTIYNNIMKILKAHEINKIFSEALVNQFTALKTELIDLKTILEQLHSNYNNIGISISTLTQLTSDDVLNTKKIVGILNNINNAVKKIPNKDTIIDMLTIRTKLLFTDTISIVSEYLTNIIARQPLTQIGGGNNNIFNVNSNKVNNNINKNAFIEEKLYHKIDEIKQQYINEVFQLSKNTIDNNIKDDINAMLNDAFNNVIYLVLNPEQQNTLDQLLYNIDHCIKQLTTNLISLYSNNLQLTSFFDD